MKNKIAAMIITGTTIVGLSAAPAFAWDYGLSGSGACQPDGSYKITWVLDNTDASTQHQVMTVKGSSNTAVVPVGTQVAADSTADFTQSASGTVAATFDLKLNVNWPGDQADHIQKAKVMLAQPCTQPTPPPTTPPTGGRGGGTPPVTPTTQVQSPAGPVNAGGGGGSLSTSKSAVLGLVSSVSLAGIGLGLRRFVKQS